MAFLQSARSKKWELLAAYGDEPTLHLESEGDRLIQDLSAKQLDKQLTLEKQKLLEKQFERGTGFIPLSVHNAGTSTLQGLEEILTREEKLEKLKLLGLNSKEANAVLNSDDLTFPESKVEPSVKHSRTEQIKNILENGFNKKFDADIVQRDVISRHEKELALAVKPESAETKLLQFALSCRNKQNLNDDLRPPEHPINQLKDIAKSLFCERDPLQLVKTVARKRRQYLESCQPPSGPKYCKKLDCGKGKSKWDKEEEEPVKKNVDNGRTKNYGCKNKALYTIKDGKIVEVDIRKVNNNGINKYVCDKLSESNLHGLPFVNVNSTRDSESESVNNTNNLVKLSEDDIKSLPKFSNYDKGSPSNVLYIKNLSNGFKEDDLVNLFNKYRTPDMPSIIYRLMSGKMRGQAFVTFPNTALAEEALVQTNGTVIKGKPIVIQFGKSVST